MHHRSVNDVYHLGIIRYMKLQFTKKSSLNNFPDIDGLQTIYKHIVELL